MKSIKFKLKIDGGRLRKWRFRENAQYINHLRPLITERMEQVFHENISFYKSRNDENLLICCWSKNGYYYIFEVLKESAKNGWKPDFNTPFDE